MRLTELKPRWIGAGGEGVFQPSTRPCPLCSGVGCEKCHQTGKEYEPAPERHGVGVVLDCPCGKQDEQHQLYVPFAQPLDGGPALDAKRGWQRTGDTFDTLTLTPSILRMGSCGWHGFITNGEVIKA